MRRWLKVMATALGLALVLSLGVSVSADSPTDPVHRLRFAHNDNCLAIEGGPANRANGAGAVEWECLNIDSTNHQWILQRVSDAIYLLRARHSGKCLEVANSHTHVGARIQQFDCHGQANQRWYIPWIGDGRLVLKPGHNPNLCLVMNGRAVLGECYGQDPVNKRFSLEVI